MFLIVVSEQDQASVNIRKRLIDSGNWSKIEDISFDNNQVYKFKNSAFLVSIQKYHLYFDNIDVQFIEVMKDQGIQIKPEVIIFPSKHRSESGRKTLTTHPVGNWGPRADFGGKPESLSISAPHQMTNAYRNILFYADEEYGNNQPYSIAFEVTHHGPLLQTPSFFIEIGSDESSWVDQRAGEIIAKSIMKTIDTENSDENTDFPVAVGIGGGHYAPRHSDLARKKQISMGHMIPNYALENISEKMLVKALERTPGAKNVYFHRKAMKKSYYHHLKEWYDDLGYNVVRSDDLENLDHM
jgi:D-aminoacyl-tRNA deacylase